MLPFDKKTIKAKFTTGSIALNIATYVNRVITAMQVLFCFFLIKCTALRNVKDDTNNKKCVREKPLNKYDKYKKENKVNISTRVSYYMYS